MCWNYRPFARIEYHSNFDFNNLLITFFPTLTLKEDAFIPSLSSFHALCLLYGRIAYKDMNKLVGILLLLALINTINCEFGVDVSQLFT